MQDDRPQPHPRGPHQTIQETDDNHDWLQTSQGGVLPLSDFGASLGVENAAINPRETARVLSGIERFGARCLVPYTVAEHSVRVAWRVRDLGGSVLDQFYGLNHEGDESLLGFDPPSPMLRLLPDLRAMKRRAHLAYFTRYALDPDLPAVVKEADLDLLVTERRDFMAHCSRPWHPSIESRTPLQGRIVPWSREAAQAEFLREWSQLARLMLDHSIFSDDFDWATGSGLRSCLEAQCT